MKTILTEIIVDRSAEIVWNVLIDFPSYPEWNPFITSIEGQALINQKISVTIQPPGGKSMKFKPKLLNVEVNNELRWKGMLFAPGLFDGEHYFQLRPMEHGKTLLNHGEHFSGILVNLFSKNLVKTEEGFELMNNALKDRCEQMII